MSGLLQDVRLSLRAFKSRPGFTAVAVSTIALGIAASAAIWSVVDAVLVRPLPFSQPERLVFVWETMPARQVERNVAGPANLVRWRERARSFTGLAGYIRFETNLASDGGEPERIPAGFTTGNLMSVLGVRPLLGRTLVEADSAPGAPDVVVLSEGFWRRRFGGDPQAVGRTLRLNGQLHTIVGVMPASLQIPPGTALWAPLSVDENMRSARGRWMTVVARLKDGVSVAQARDEMARLGEALGAEETMDAGWGVNVQPLHADLVRELRPGLVLLLIAVALLMLIACVNVANLLLAAGVVRERELAIRGALGAGRGRLLRQLLTESLVLAALAGSLGALAGRWLLGAILWLLPPEVAEVVAVGYDLRVVGAAALVAFASAIAFGAVPAFQSARAGLLGTLKEGGSVRGSGLARSRLKQGLVVAEVGLSALLLVATGLLLRSFWTLGSLSPGFDAQGVLAARVSPGGDAYRDRARVTAFYEDAMRRLRGLPGVSAAGAISWTPLASGGGAATSFKILGRETPRPGQEPVTDVRVVTPGTFEALRIPLVRGRDFGLDDRSGQPAVAIVNEALARELGPPGQDLGQRLQLAWGKDAVVEVVGVVGDVRLSSLETPARATVYLPHAQDGNNFMTLMLRSSGPPAALVPGVRAALAAVDPALPLGSALPLEQVVSESLRTRRFVLVLVAVFGGAALALAGIGLFGVMAYLVAQRTSELGVRLMLGARPLDVLRLVVRDGMRLVAAGLVLGLLAGVAASRALESQLFQVSPADPLALLGVALALALVSLAALAAPAWRAASIEPARALRAL